ncbi:MAG: hypothetical protein QXJ07_01935 [Candidatus Bathyarchaeia archaeon]
MRRSEIGKNSKTWSRMDAFMLMFCFVAFAILGYWLVKQILS